MDLNINNVGRPGDKLELHYVNNQNIDYFLSTSIYDVLSDNEFLIYNPLKEGKLFLVPMNLNITAVLKREEYGVLIFQIHLASRKKIGNIYAIKCNVISEIKKQQRRGYFRVSFVREIKIMYLLDENKKEIDYYVFDPDTINCEEVNIKVNTTDISGGGLGFRSKLSFNIGTYIYFKLEDFNTRNEIYGTVKKCFKSLKHDGEYEIGIAFEELPNDFIRKITSYVFSSQQKIRRKEKD